MEPDSRIWASPDLLKIWMWCLLKANFEDKGWHCIRSGNGEITVEVKKGQFVFGRLSASKELGVCASTIWVRMNKLQKWGFVDIKSNSKYSLITICNYEYYQGRDNEQLTAKMTATAKLTAKMTAKVTAYQPPQSKGKRQLDNSEGDSEDNSEDDTTKEDKEVKEKNIKNIKKKPIYISWERFNGFLDNRDFLVEQADKLNKTENEVSVMIRNIRDHCSSKNVKYYNLPATLRTWFRNESNFKSREDKYL